MHNHKKHINSKECMCISVLETEKLAEGNYDVIDGDDKQF